LASLTPIAPNLGQHIQQQHLITPADYEQNYNLTEGSIFHGQMSLDQLLVMRPVPAWGQYSTPIKNLFLCGAGTHPGGGVTGAPGFNAAQVVLNHLS
jgi:phytoene dehydrogenase-like protein